MKRFMKRVLAVVALTVLPSIAAAESYVRMENFWKPSQSIHVQTGPVESGSAEPGWWSADWTIEPVTGSDFVRIKNRWRSNYLHVENGSLDAGAIKPGWHSAMWTLESAPVGAGYYRIKNRWTGAYINVESGRIAAGPAQPGWHSAMWKLKGYRAAPARPAAAKPYTVNAGPIWNQKDAESKCPALASSQSATWTGHWWTTVQGKMSVCQLKK